MALNDFVSQMILLTFTILAGVATWLATRKRRNGGGEHEQHTHARPTIFNGYAALLERTLERAQRLEERNRDLEQHADELEQHVADLERQLDELRRQRRATRRTPPPTSTTRKRNAS